MRISLMPIAVLNRLLSAAVLTGMFTPFVLYATDPAAAAVVLSQCQRKHSLCTERCIMNNKKIEAGNACIKRTCDKQNPGCGAASIGKSGGGKLIQTNPGGSTGGYSGGGVLTSPSGGAGSWTSTGGVFTTKSGGAVQETKRHSQPKQTPTAEPKPAPTTEPTPTAEPKSTPPVTSPRIVRDHRVTPNVGDDRSSPGVTRTPYNYDGAVKASGTGPSEKRKPKIIDHREPPKVIDHRGVDTASRNEASEKRKPKIIDHRGSNAGTSSSASAGSSCDKQGTPPCRAQ